MHMTSTDSTHTPAASILSRRELEAVLATAGALEKTAPHNVRLSDEITLTERVFWLAWISKRDNAVLDVDLTSNVDGRIVESLTACLTRRLEARAANRAIQELPCDSKQIALNKAIHEAEARGIQVSRMAAATGEPVAVKSEEPRAVLLVNPREEPLAVKGDFLVSGSNVVGGPKQLLLLEDTLVDVTYFLHEAPYSQIRAKVPLSLAMVKNLATRICGEFIRANPDDTHLTAAKQPDVYVPARDMPTIETVK